MRLLLIILLYSVIFFYLRGIFIEVICKLEVGRNFEIIERKSDIHVSGSKLMPYPWKNWILEACLSRNLTAILRTDVREKLKIANKVWKSWDLLKCHGFMRGQVITYAAYKPEDLRRSFRELRISRKDLYSKWKLHRIFNVKFFV